MRHRSKPNPDFIDRQIAVERKLRRLPRGAGDGPVSYGDWYDLSSHLSVASPEVLAQTEGFGIRRVETTAGAAWAEFRGAVLLITDSAVSASLLDTAMPSEYWPLGQLHDVFVPIDTDNPPSSFYPIDGGWSFNITTTGQIVNDAALVVVNLGASPPVLQHAGAGNNQGAPKSGVALIFNGIRYDITDDV